jgi:hypothetical protein
MQFQLLSMQKILSMGCRVCFACSLVLVPLSLSFATTKTPGKPQVINKGHAQHHHRSLRLGVFGILGFPVSPTPPIIYAPPPAVVYIEKDSPQNTPPQSLWYYCRSQQIYYPYIIECPEAWEEVNPTIYPSN